MGIKFCGILFTLIIGFFYSCTSQPEAPKLLREASKLAENNPVEAMNLIDSIADPENSLTKEQYMQYLVTRVQVYYKNFRDISRDTLIFEARDYFRRKRNNYSNLRFLSYFYSGSVYREQQRNNLAINEYKHALTIAEEESNKPQQAFVHYNIGNLYFEQHAYQTALDYYKKAVINYKSDTAKILISLAAAGQSSLLLGERDSALTYFDQALQLTREIGNKSEEAKSLQNKAVTLYEQRNYQDAIPLLQEAVKIDPDSSEVARYNLNLARTYKSLGVQDSVTFYVRELEKSMDKIPDLYFQSAVSKFLADVYIDKGDYPTAINYLQIRDSCIRQIAKNTNVKELASAEREYDLAKKESLLAKEKMRSYRLGLIVTICCLIIVITGSGLFYQNLKHKRQKEENLRLQQQASQNECLVAVYRNHIGNVGSFKNQVDNLIVSYSRRGVEDASVGFEKIKNAVDEMETKIQTGYSTFITDYLHTLSILSKEQIEILKSEDQLLITLLQARYSHAEIAGLLRVTNHALTTRKSRLKDKLQRIGLQESQINRIFSV